MKTTVIKFRIDNQVYVIPTDYIKQIFYAQKIVSMLHMNDYVIGSVQQGISHYLLLCLKKILNINECKEIINKPVLLLEFQNNAYAFLIDEILALEEFDQNSSRAGSLYEKDDVVFQELPLQHILQSLTFPPLQQSEEKKVSQNTKEHFRPLLLFTLQNRLYAIDNSFIHSIVPITNIDLVQQFQQEWIAGIYNFKNSALKVADLAKKLSLESSKEGSVIILQDDSQVLGLLIERIEGLLDIAYEDIIIESDPQQLFEGYFHYQNSIIPIISSSIIQDSIKKYGLLINTHNTSVKKEYRYEEDFLLISLFQEDYAVPIDNIITILELSKTDITNNALTTHENIQGLILYKNKTYHLLNIAKMLKKDFIPTDESKILIIKTNERHEYAIIVDSIKDIVSVSKAHIAYLPNTTSLSAGIVTLDTKSFNLFNIGWKTFN
ncbi:chemotaxis protein CheW [Nitratiruptor tergarcus]|uniref:Chemotaxis signal transduction protein n=1 Tax=Nitratiruptor tergarcus DSM 16512 TaxID=1069081 RepID=A0A1W1WRQ7_9BACT|nr:chemotaxis protein CheW [Nitratiruptor tergarcus]SMC08967.1 Chemotaxis signal transduction protein [Nitratiruptor tergarcus DSM 16512]